MQKINGWLLQIFAVRLSEDCLLYTSTQKKLTIDFVTGKFGGTMVGDGVEIKGYINLAQQIPHYDLHLELYNILPASLGIADIKDTVSITCLLYTSGFGSLAGPSFMKMTLICCWKSIKNLQGLPMYI